MKETDEDILKDNEIQFAFEEYKMLRAEISNKMNNQYKILSLGIGGITILFGVIMKTSMDELFIAMPFLVIANAFLYRTEGEAIINAGLYIRKIENILYRNNTKVDETQKMGWENYLKRKVYKPFNYVADIIFISLYFLSILKVVYYLFSLNMLYNSTLKIIIITSYIAIVLILFLFYILLIKKFSKHNYDGLNVR